MKEETPAPAPKGGICWSYPFLILVLGSTMASCFLRSAPSDAKTKPQEWRESRGPVIPHDTFPKDCTLCHAKGSWHEIRSDFTFDHGKETGVAMNGAHATAQCLRCHNDRGPVSTFAKRGCTGCHEDIHRGRLGIKCTTCHSENDWNPTGVYAVHAQTRFPLQGVHAGVTCSRCHPSAVAGQFIGADPRCEACHRQNAISAKTFDHAAQSALINCQQCHNQVSWADANPHTGNFSDCYRCHRANFEAQNLKDPNHGGYGTNCANCHHSTVTWSGATGHLHIFNQNHHNNGTCTNCHTPPNFAAFSCILGGCHPKGETDSKHEPQNAPGYVYVSQNCYNCHMTGNGPKPQKARRPSPRTRGK